MHVPSNAPLGGFELAYEMKGLIAGFVLLVAQNLQALGAPLHRLNPKRPLTFASR